MAILLVDGIYTLTSMSNPPINVQKPPLAHRLILSDKMCNKCIIVSIEHFENGSSEIFEGDPFCDCPCEEHTDEDDIKCHVCNHKLALDK